MSQESFAITNKTKGNLPTGRLPFQALKETVLGKNYALSLVFVTTKESQKLNKIYREKNKPTNILSFPLNDQTGEIVICPTIAKQEAPKFDRSFENYLGFLFIHGLLHLKGFDHGSTMENEEQKIRTQFGI